MDTVACRQDELRTFSVMGYASETDNIGKRHNLTWPQVAGLLQLRDIRQKKSGKAFAPVEMKPGTTRARENVLAISMAVADIDSEGEKDKRTGRLVSVTKRAPTLDELRPRIGRYTWIAHSSHGHDPQRLGGIIKYRVVFPFTRACTQAEWPEVWQGMNVLLGGHCDAQCKDLSRLYYLPSCPPETAQNAFVESNEGEYLDPDFLIALARKAGPPSAVTFPTSNLSGNANLSAPAETPGEVERIKSMLASIPADCNREQWRNVLWSIASTDWTCAESIAREWSRTASEIFDDEEFRRVWQSFKSDGGVRFGSLVRYAKLAGWVDILKPGEFSGAVGGDSGDILNGKVFAQLHRDKLKFVKETRVWLKFERRVGWVHALPGEEIRAAECVVAEFRKHAAEKWKTAPDDTKTKRLMAHVERSSSAQKIRDMIEMAKPKPGMTVRLRDLDADPMLLGVANGVLNLRTGNLLPPSPSLLVTKRCPVPFDPGATAPTLDAFIKRITRGKPTLAKFLQRLAGYVLTGAVHEQCFAFLYGLGRNGKTTYAELLRWLLGDYAVVLPTTTLMLAKRDPGAATPDLMLLKGSRLALATELEESARFAEAAIKAMTGGDTMQARNPYGLYASWTPTHKLMVVGNHRPVISGGDLGIWRRVRLIPFEETISDSECDDKLPDKLRTEGSGVLNWALAGLRDWQCQGLNPPAEVKAAGAAYQTDMDVLGQWMGDHVDTVAGVTTPTADLYRAYSAWARDSGYRYPMTRSAFGRRLVERGIPLVKSATGIKCASGIALNNEGKHAAARFP
ncbi:phage/plasmid primase, P4 family [Paraburkholderia sediminicola]|uniref:phage/plasmid primase, P4 family n=1 Tax=Paraburkholderia sediminicola TaxID=458836 RepID=UPI0038BC576D